MASIPPTRRKTPATTRTHTRTREDGSTFEQRGKARANGEGSSFLRTIRHTRQDGTVYTKLVWCAYVPLPNGKRKTVYGKTQEEAAQKKREAERDLDAGLQPASGHETVLSWLTTYLDKLEADGLTPNTLTRYRGLLVHYLAPALGKVKLAQLTPAHVQRYQTDLLKQGVPGRTVTLHRSLLGGALKQAAALGLVPRNVVSLVKPPRAAKDGKGRMLTPDEARAFLATLAGDRLEAFFLLCLTAGLRRGEALGVRWEDLDLDRHDLHVRQQVQWPHGQPALVPLKTRKARRTIPLPALTLDALRARQAMQELEHQALGATWSADGLVFNSEKGAVLHRNTVQAQFRGHLQAAGIGTLRLHDLRHTYGSLLMSQGVPLKTISELLGHASIAVTADTYLHVLEVDRHDTAASIAQALAGPSLVALGTGARCPTCGQPVPVEQG